ncbi:hypothetical protein J1C73_32040, partial [Streptomyces laculatispora]|nr:hypothetical protein [Streptomyces laculatispora]
MTHKGRILFAVALSTMALGLTACNDDEDASSAQDSPSASAPTSSDPGSKSPSASPGDDGAAPAGGDTTAPGTKLKIGDKAVLPFTYGTEKKGTIAVTVTAMVPF